MCYISRHLFPSILRELLIMFVFATFFWTCITRKKEKTCSVGVFPDKSGNTHIWLILVLFRRRKSGGVGLGFVCVAFFSGLSYHTQAQPLPLELARCLWVVLLMQWVFSSCIAGCCSREKPEAFLVPELLWREVLGHGLPLFQRGTKMQNYQGIGICLISASWQEIEWDRGFCLRQCAPSRVTARIKEHLKSPKEHWGGCPGIHELKRLLPLSVHLLFDLRH